MDELIPYNPDALETCGTLSDPRSNSLTLTGLSNSSADAALTQGKKLVSFLLDLAKIPVDHQKNYQISSPAPLSNNRFHDSVLIEGPYTEQGGDEMNNLIKVIKEFKPNEEYQKKDFPFGLGVFWTSSTVGREREIKWTPVPESVGGEKAGFDHVRKVHTDDIVKEIKKELIAAGVPFTAVAAVYVSVLSSICARPPAEKENFQFSPERRSGRPDPLDFNILVTIPHYDPALIRRLTDKASFEAQNDTHSAHSLNLLVREKITNSPIKINSVWSPPKTIPAPGAYTIALEGFAMTVDENAIILHLEDILLEPARRAGIRNPLIKGYAPRRGGWGSKKTKNIYVVLNSFEFAAFACYKVLNFPTNNGRGSIFSYDPTPIYLYFDLPEHESRRQEERKSRFRTNQQSSDETNLVLLSYQNQLNTIAATQAAHKTEVLETLYRTNEATNRRLDHAQELVISTLNFTVTQANLADFERVSEQRRLDRDFAMQALNVEVKFLAMFTKEGPHYERRLVHIEELKEKVKESETRYQEALARANTAREGAASIRAGLLPRQNALIEASKDTAQVLEKSRVKEIGGGDDVDMGEVLVMVAGGSGSTQLIESVDDEIDDRSSKRAKTQPTTEPGTQSKVA